MDEPPISIKHEPPVEFVLILPRPTGDWPQKDVKPKLIPSVTLTKFDAKCRVKARMFQTFFACQHCQRTLKYERSLFRHLKSACEINPASFECDHCGRRFQPKYVIRKHMAMHSSERKFICTGCGFRFKDKHGLLMHSSGRTIYKCDECDVKFPCKLLLERHRSDSHGNVFKCDNGDCSYETKHLDYLMKHKRTHNTSIQCETCQKKHLNNRHLKNHQRQHKHGVYATAPEETFDCDKCDKSFSNLTYLRDHQKRVHVNNEVKCEDCGKIFKNQFSLNQHNRTHDKIECTICRKMITKYFMAAHIQEHSAANHFRCDLCGHSTKIKADLKRHIDRMHLLKKLVMSDSAFREDSAEFELLEKLQLQYGSSATTNERRFKCDQCGKSYATTKRLKDHKREVHVDATFECEVCKKAFKTKKNLTQHMSIVHSRLSCSICNKEVGEGRIKSHLKSHLAGKQFQCDLCYHKNDSKQHLESHIVRIHLDSALKCKFGCIGKFSDIYQISDHHKIHVGNKQWKCSKCDICLQSMSDFSRHLSAKKHKRNNYSLTQK